MDSKHYTQVLIDGKVYTLGGSEDEGYLQRVASYVNEKIGAMRRLAGFTKQNNEYQTAMIALNIADDYFKSQDQAVVSREERDHMERETYSLKHELVSTQMKLEAVLKDLEDRQSQLENLKKEKGRLERKVRELEKAGEVQAALREAAASNTATAETAAIENAVVSEEAAAARATAIATAESAGTAAAEPAGTIAAKPADIAPTAAAQPDKTEPEEAFQDAEAKRQELTRRALHAAMEARGAAHKKY